MLRGMGAFVKGRILVIARVWIRPPLRRGLSAIADWGRENLRRCSWIEVWQLYGGGVKVSPSVKACGFATSLVRGRLERSAQRGVPHQREA